MGMTPPVAACGPVPFGGGVGRIMRLGFQPVNITAQFYGSAVHPPGCVALGHAASDRSALSQTTDPRCATAVRSGLPVTVRHERERHAGLSRRTHRPTSRYQICPNRSVAISSKVEVGACREVGGNEVQHADPGVDLLQSIFLRHSGSSTTCRFHRPFIRFPSRGPKIGWMRQRRELNHSL
jgi:hypothetical protein